MLNLSTFRRSALCMLVMLCFGVLLPAGAVSAQAINLQRPGERDFVVDIAGLLNPQQTEQVKKTADELLTQTAIPLWVVTIERKSDYSSGLSIEQFARQLYDQWGLGQATINGQQYNRGILLVVARTDREARIELGAGYAGQMDSQTQWIMDNRILPRFKADDYGGGIVAGTNALAEMARGELKTSGLLVTAQQTPWWVYALIVGGLVLAVFTAISMHRSGRHGWAWVFWGIVFALLFMLVKIAVSSRGSSGGGGFGGGSFGGGSGGGGGATGRW